MVLISLTYIVHKRWKLLEALQLRIYHISFQMCVENISMHSLRNIYKYAIYNCWDYLHKSFKTLYKLFFGIFKYLDCKFYSFFNKSFEISNCKSYLHYQEYVYHKLIEAQSHLTSKRQNIRKHVTLLPLISGSMNAKEVHLNANQNKSS